MPFFYFFDPTYLLIIIGLILSGLASAYVGRTFNKYNQSPNKRGISGRQAARAILDDAGLYDVKIEHVKGDLTDHYSPNEKVLRLSDSTDKNNTVAAVGVAAHEAGHALQHQEGYAPMKLRSAIVPVVNLASTASMPILFAGILFGFNQTLINIGIVLFAATFLFQLITLPVEFNASNRAMAIIEQNELLVGEEVNQASKVLRAAALTYVASAIASLLSVLRLLILFGGRSRD